MKTEFDIIYTFQPNGETYIMVFFVDGDDIFKTNINSSAFGRFNSNSNSGDVLQAYIRKRYDYHPTSVFKIDDVEIKGLYEHFKSIEDEYNIRRVFSVIRNRKIDDILYSS